MTNSTKSHSAKQTEKKQWFAKMGTLAKQVRAMSEDEKNAFIDRLGGLVVTCEGHTLTPYNTIFLLYQVGKVNITMIGGFKQWQKVGRRVRKGQHAIGHIYVPMGAKKLDDDSDEGEPEEIRFRLVPVFDVSQTDEINKLKLAV